MNKSLNEIASQLNINPKVLRILMLSKSDLFNQFTYIDNGEIICESKAYDELMDLYKNKEKIYVTFESIADIMDVPVETVVNVLTINKDEMFKCSIKKSPHGRMETNLFKCKMLNELLHEISGESPIRLKTNTTNDMNDIDDKNDTTDNIVDDESIDLQKQTSFESNDDTTITTVSEIKSKSNEPKKKVIRKKKAKYAMTLDVVMKICTDINNIKNIRLFLLSLPDYKPDNIAIMSDTEVRHTFEENHIAIELPTGLWIMNKNILPTLIDNDDMFFIENI